MEEQELLRKRKIAKERMADQFGSLLQSNTTIIVDYVTSFIVGLDCARTIGMEWSIWSLSNSSVI